MFSVRPGTHHNLPPTHQFSLFSGMNGLASRVPQTAMIDGHTGCDEQFAVEKREVLAGVLRQPGPYALARRVYRVAAVVIQQRLRSRRASAQADPDLPTPAFDALGRHAHPLLDWSSCLDDAATADAAAALGLTRDEARSHIHRARLYVRAELAKLFS